MEIFLLTYGKFLIWVFQKNLIVMDFCFSHRNIYMRIEVFGKSSFPDSCSFSSFMEFVISVEFVVECF
jgi:hypothetical protein